jgi:hypothetical protein
MRARVATTRSKWAALINILGADWSGKRRPPGAEAQVREAFGGTAGAVPFPKTFLRPALVARRRESVFVGNGISQGSNAFDGNFDILTGDDWAYA